MTIPVNPTTAQPPLDSSVVTDTPCRKCGYNLRGLAVVGLCPECAMPVRLSVFGDLLRYSDPQYVRTLARGVRLILWGMLATLIAALAAGALQAIKLGPAAQLLMLAASALNIWGSWLLTEPDPSGLGEEQYGTARKTIRVALIVGASGSVLDFLAEITAQVHPALRLAFQMISFAAGIFQLVGVFAELIYLQRLAARIPDDKLTARAKTVRWGLGISYGALLLFGLIALIMTGTLSAPATPALGAVACIAALALIPLLIFSVMYLFMLNEFRKQFNQQAIVAQQNWGTPS